MGAESADGVIVMVVGLFRWIELELELKLESVNIVQTQFNDE
jgi:hypothetical protein